MLDRVRKGLHYDLSGVLKRTVTNLFNLHIFHVLNEEGSIKRLGYLMSDFIWDTE